MQKEPLYIGDALVQHRHESVQGEYVDIEGETYYKIAHYDHMDPFFMSIVSDSDHWMFIWSTGALSAGRKDADNALFPYYTDDKILDSTDITGSKTLVIARVRNKRYFWEPFSHCCAALYRIERNCYKNIYGNKLIFEEINHDLELAFSYAWMNSEQFGFVKRSRIINHGDETVEVEMLDGIQNILAYGINQRFQLKYSTLADAYKKNELEPKTGLGIFSLSSIPVDRAEPSESIRATVAWRAGLKADKTLLSSRQLDTFRRGDPIRQETDVRAARGAYFVNTHLNLTPKEQQIWYIAADINVDSAGIVNLERRLRVSDSMVREIETDIMRGRKNLIKTVANADGLQMSADRLSTSRHFSNVLFNIMRGGIFHDDYHIETADFIKFVKKASQRVYEKHYPFLQTLPEKMLYPDLTSRINAQQDPEFEKLNYEYLPLTFSRRHGDPSRPWNRFCIDIKDAQGGKNLNYQGNWRDIFQNWEALALSFPHYIEGMITKFVNASTADGYNPYRIERDGFEWEIIDPDDAWSYIGYWGDHQIIYLLKLLELSQCYHPGMLRSLLSSQIFAYANVPYRIKSYEAIQTDPHNTVDFDAELEADIEERVAAMGTDGKFILNEDGTVYQVTLAEKLMVPVLVKLSNFIPGAGIWMNTQRPEWNDANNALVGYGVSIVTLCYLRRQLAFLEQLFSGIDEQMVFSTAVADFFDAVCRILRENRFLLAGEVSDSDRKKLLDALGTAGSTYRAGLYAKGFSGKRKEISVSDLSGFCRKALHYIDHTIQANRRDDGLYHAYNLITATDADKISIRRLYEMLEGQVAVLSSGYLKPEESVEVLAALRKSSLYREDQATYLLYPDRDLPRFSKKNTIPPEICRKSKLIQRLADSENTEIVVQDNTGGFHFNGDFRNGAVLKKALRKLDIDTSGLDMDAEKKLLVQIYERMFDHRSFTGRSGTFFKYEGLGSTYWHMVSKLLLAVQECFYRAVGEQTAKQVQADLYRHYYEIRAGIGVAKSPDLYGAFPTDPYSHTPAHAGVQQPGMTGQVKEDVISRFGELGVIIQDGHINFLPALLRKEEFLDKAGTFTYVDMEGEFKTIFLEAGSLAFTLVQVPVVYHSGNKARIVISRADGRHDTIDSHLLDRETSWSIFGRTGEIRQIDVYFIQ